MIIKLAKNSGFCPGVKRAIHIARDAAQKQKNLVTLGPIIHNPQMVQYLAERGVGYVDEPSQLHPGQTVIIRSHGVTREIDEELKTKDVTILDATCPYVARAHRYAKELRDQDYMVMILGDAEHPEVIGLVSYTDGEGMVVADASKFPEQSFARLGIISQTTQPVGKLQELVAVAVEHCEDLRVINTICSATSIRQSSTLKLAQASDLMIVIGGRNSSNTKMLARICEKWVETHQIEAAEEIVVDWFENKQKVGLTAGASTPDWVILEVYNKIIEKHVGRESMVDRVEDIPGYKEE